VDSIKDKACLDEPEITTSKFGSPMFDAEKVLIENQQLKTKLAELQTVIVNMCVQQQKQ
jgi:hypothetical protein